MVVACESNASFGETFYATMVQQCSVARNVIILIFTRAPLHKTFAGVFYGKNSGNSGKKKNSIAICIKICQSFSMAKKKSGKKFYATGPRYGRNKHCILKSSGKNSKCVVIFRYP